MSVHHGPWFANDRFVSTRDGGSGDIAVVQPDHGNEVEIARLIAAAPALLSLAKRWVALDGGAWNVERHAAGKKELLAETRTTIEKLGDGR